MARAGSALCFIAAVLIALTGGFRTEVAHVRVSAQWPLGLSFAAWVLLLVDWRRSPSRAADIEPFSRARQRAERHGGLIAGTISLATAVLAVGCGSLTAAGADAYGYVSQALLWAGGNPAQFQPMLALAAPWPDAEWSFCPLGYKPSSVSGLMVPTYPAGLSLLMAIFVRLLGPNGAWVVVPVSGGLIVFSTYKLAQHLVGDRLRAILCAMLVACSPVLLFQLLQPMSDVPVTAWWMLSIVAALDATAIGALGSGLCASLALLIRPNLALTAVAVAAYNYWSKPGPAGSRLTRVGLFVLATIPGVVLAVVINVVLYGAPFESGYGSFAAIYDLANAGKNLTRYPAWLYSSHSLLLFAGLCLPLVAVFATRPGDRRRALTRHGLLAAGFVMTVFASYLFYIVFDHWTYLRFVLPAIPLLIVLGVAAVDAVAGMVSDNARAMAMAFIALVLPAYYVSYAVHGEAFKLKSDFRDSFEAAGRQIQARTPTSTVVVSVLQSGSLRMYADRLTVRYDYIPVDWLERAIAFLNRSGRVPYLALHAQEQETFARRFPNETTWIHESPTVEITPPGAVTLYGPLARLSASPREAR